MNDLNLAHQRLINQNIASYTHKNPGDLVQFLGAVQSQDYAGGKWAIGLRLQGFTDFDIEQAIADRTIVRSWPMRGTLHFVVPKDLRWMLQLLTPRIIAGSKLRNQQLGLDDTTFNKSKDLFISELQGNRQLSRNAMYQILEKAHISVKGQRGIHILWRLSQEGLLCFGKREGKQQTFVLLDEWLPKTKIPDHDEALAEIALRYFTGHGPATLQDFIWWTGLQAAEAKKGFEMVKSKLVKEVMNNIEIWQAQPKTSEDKYLSGVYFMPAFDEYLVGYKDRSAAIGPANKKWLKSLLSPTIIANGEVIGTWTRTIKNNKIVIFARPFTNFDSNLKPNLVEAAECYGLFMNKNAELTYKPTF